MLLKKSRPSLSRSRGAKIDRRMSHTGPGNNGSASATHASMNERTDDAWADESKLMDSIHPGGAPACAGSSAALLLFFRVAAAPFRAQLHSLRNQFAHKQAPGCTAKLRAKRANTHTQRQQHPPWMTRSAHGLGCDILSEYVLAFSRSSTPKLFVYLVDKHGTRTCKRTVAAIHSSIHSFTARTPSHTRLYTRPHRQSSNGMDPVCARWTR